jgi:AraC family transcriptional regulator
MFNVDAITNDGMQKNQKNEYRNTQALHEQSPLVFPKSAAWNGISIEHHRQPAAECELHLPQHTFCILLHECATERRVDGKKICSNHAEQGEVIIYPASSHQWIRWQEETEFLLLFLDASLVEQTKENVGGYEAIEIVESEKEFRDPLLQQIGLALKAELDEGMVSSSALYAESLATALSAHVLRRYAVQKQIIRDITGHPSNIVLKRVIEYIHDNLDQNLTLAELSFIANMSSYHFAHIFKQATGMAPHQYVLHTRIERAKSLLLQGKLSIAEVAMRVGFFDQSHFTRYFKRTVGVTPQTLLRQNSKNLPISS